MVGQPYYFEKSFFELVHVSFPSFRLIQRITSIKFFHSEIDPQSAYFLAVEHDPDRILPFPRENIFRFEPEIQLHGILRLELRVIPESVVKAGLSIILIRLHGFRSFHLSTKAYRLTVV